MHPCIHASTIHTSIYLIKIYNINIGFYAPNFLSISGTSITKTTAYIGQSSLKPDHKITSLEGVVYFEQRSCTQSRQAARDY